MNQTALQPAPDSGPRPGPQPGDYSPFPLRHRLGHAAKHTIQVSPNGPWRGVFFEGPQSDQDAEGDEIPVWFVYIGDEQANPLGRVYRCHSYSLGENLARRMAGDRHLQLVTEAMPA